MRQTVSIVLNVNILSTLPVVPSGVVASRFRSSLLFLFVTLSGLLGYGHLYLSPGGYVIILPHWVVKTVYYVLPLHFLLFGDLREETVSHILGILLLLL